MEKDNKITLGELDGFAGGFDTDIFIYGPRPLFSHRGTHIISNDYVTGPTDHHGFRSGNGFGEGDGQGAGDGDGCGDGDGEGDAIGGEEFEGYGY